MYKNPKEITQDAKATTNNEAQTARAAIPRPDVHFGQHQHGVDVVEVHPDLAA